MTHKPIQDDWHRLLHTANPASSRLDAGDTKPVAPDLKAVRDFLVRNADVTAREADEIIEWRLLPAYSKAGLSIPVE